MVVLLLPLCGCIGSSSPRLHNYGGAGQLQNGDIETDEGLEHRLVGLTRDDVVIKYGPPSRTFSLDNGDRIMQYNRRATYIEEKGSRSYYNCELRLWLDKKIVRKVDYRGDQNECLLFVNTGRHSLIKKKLFWYD